MRVRVLAVERLDARLLQTPARVAAELDGDDLVVGAVADRDGRRAREVELEALDRRDEPAQRDQRGRARPAGGEAERVRHRRALREAADDRPVEPDARLVRQRVEPGGE